MGKKWTYLMLVTLSVLVGCSSKVLRYEFDGCRYERGNARITVNVLGVLNRESRPMELGAPYFVSVEVEGDAIKPSMNVDLMLNSAESDWSWSGVGGLERKFEYGSQEVKYFFDAYDLSIPYENMRVRAVVSSQDLSFDETCQLRKTYREEHRSFFAIISAGV